MVSNHRCPITSIFVTLFSLWIYITIINEWVITTKLWIKWIKSSACVFGDGFSSFRDCVSSEFPGEEELDGGLNLTWAECSPLVESDELGWLECDSVEAIVDEGVHDVHCLSGDSDLRVNLLQNFVDVESECLNPPSASLFVFAGSLSSTLNGFDGLLGLSGFSSWWFLWCGHLLYNL